MLPHVERAAGGRTRTPRGLPGVLLAVLLGLAASPMLSAAPERVAAVKVVRGQVEVLRGQARLAAYPGLAIWRGDRIVTGGDGAVGLTFEDNSLISLGPGSEYAVDDFVFDRTTHSGRFVSTLRRGKLAVVSGRIAKQTRDAMQVRTPNSVLGVRGTRFVIEAGDP